MTTERSAVAQRISQAPQNETPTRVKMRRHPCQNETHPRVKMRHHHWLVGWYWLVFARLEYWWCRIQHGGEW